MSGNYLEDIDNFISKLGPPDQLLINRFEVGCIVCSPTFIVGRNFNTKAKLVNHFKSDVHALNVQNAEARKEDHIKTVEENLQKIDDDIKNIEEQIAADTAKIGTTELDTVNFKEYLLQNKTTSETEIAFESVDKEQINSTKYQCPKCSFRTGQSKLKKFIKHLSGHPGDSSCQMLLLKLA
ncbi:hypothetical protein ACHWQZ_G017159 [Mnemiopsis leidyi]